MPPLFLGASRLQLLEASCFYEESSLSVLVAEPNKETVDDPGPVAPVLALPNNDVVADAGPVADITQPYNNVIAESSSPPNKKRKIEIERSLCSLGKLFSTTSSNLWKCKICLVNQNPESAAKCQSCNNPRSAGRDQNETAPQDGAIIPTSALDGSKITESGFSFLVPSTTENKEGDSRGSKRDFRQTHSPLQQNHAHAAPLRRSKRLRAKRPVSN